MMQKIKEIIDTGNRVSLWKWHLINRWDQRKIKPRIQFNT